MVRMALLKYLPEATVTTAFFPMGVFMGYIMQIHFAGLINLNQDIVIIINSSQWWPWVAGSVAAIFTGTLLFGLKIKFRQYRYEQLYCLCFGMLLFFVAGILFMTTTIPYAAIYISFVAHGISYIAALSYINIRLGKTKFRFLRLSIPLVFYIFAVAIGATVVYGQINFYVLNSPTAPVNDVIGILLVISSIGTISCILILEYNVYYGDINYKSSLDEDINRENKNFSIFERKYFLITSKSRILTSMPLTTINNNRDYYLRLFFFYKFAIISKITSIMYFYWPFIFVHHTMSIASLNYELFSINWFGLFGVIISTLLLFPITYKIQHCIGLLIQITSMVVLLVILPHELTTRELSVVMWFFFMTLGFAFPNSDINILSYTNLRFTEIALTLGYVVLNITVGVIQYIMIQTPTKIIRLGSLFDLVFEHVIAFLVIMILLIVMGMTIMPNRDCRSLLDLQNYINTKWY